MFWIFFPFSPVCQKAWIFFLSYSVNQLLLRESRNCIIVAKLSLVSLKKQCYFLLEGIATSLKSGWTIQMCSKFTNEIILHIVSDFHCVYSLGMLYTMAVSVIHNCCYVFHNLTERDIRCSGKQRILLESCLSLPIYLNFENSGAGIPVLTCFSSRTPGPLSSARILEKLINTCYFL